MYLIIKATVSNSQNVKESSYANKSLRKIKINLRPKVEICISTYSNADVVCYSANWRTSFHGLRGSASPGLTATGFVNGKGQFRPPTESTPLDRSPKKFVASDYVGDPYGCAKFGANPSTGGFWANG